MGKITGIAWATSTWNPWIGCSKVSPACDHCYAERYANRFGYFGKIKRTAMATFNSPLKWNEPRRIFVCSLSDFFHVSADSFRAEAVKIMSAKPEHKYLLLTKRPERIIMALKDTLWDKGLPKNCWVGITGENQNMYISRMQHLFMLKDAGYITGGIFASCEPLLENIQLALKPDWVICGGESGNNARAMRPDWVRSLRDQCVTANVPFMFKQWGAQAYGHILDGKEWMQIPEEIICER